MEPKESNCGLGNCLLEGEIIQEYIRIFAPIAKKALPFCLMAYLAGTGLAQGRSWLSENTEFGRGLDRAEYRISSSGLYAGLGEAGSAICAGR